MSVSKYAGLIFLAGGVVCSGDALAAAFQLKEQSASALGNAFAGYTADADDISIMWQNPAAMTMFNRTQGLVSLSAIVPQSELKESTNSSTFGFTGTGTVSTAGDIAQDAVLPALYMMYVPEKYDDFRFGLSVNTPFGLTTSYAANSSARYSSLTSKIETITVTPSIAYKINDHWSIGGGPQIQRFDIRLSKAINCGEIANNLTAGVFGTNGGALAEDCSADNQGDDVAWGMVAGLHANYDDFRFGLAYRSSVKHDLEGDVKVDQSPLISGTGALAGLAAQLQSQNITADVRTPDTVSVGAAYDVNDRLTLLGDFVWTNWSTIDDLTINFENGLLGNTSSGDELNYKDSWFLTVGAKYDYDENMILRGGIAFDRSPIPERTRSTLLPDQDRVWLTAGVGYKIDDRMNLDLSYAHIFSKEADVNKNQSAAAGVPGFSGSYDASVDILGLQFSYKF